TTAVVQRVLEQRRPPDLHSPGFRRDFRHNFGATRGGALAPRPAVADRVVRRRHPRARGPVVVPVAAGGRAALLPGGEEPPGAGGPRAAGLLPVRRRGDVPLGTADPALPGVHRVAG